MTKLLTVLDNRAAASPVLAVACGLAPLLGCEVDALPLLGDGDAVDPRAVEHLIHAGRSDEVVAVVIGARGCPGGTALAVATGLAKPVVVVPPDAPGDMPIRRVLVPIEGARSASLTPRTIIDLTDSADIDMIALHVLDQDSLPAFTDQPQHEFQAWAAEFIRRYCRWHSGTLRLETRVGRARDLVPAVAEEVAADLVALGWSQRLGPGRAPIVRGVLERCGRPVLLVPVEDTPR